MMDGFTAAQVMAFAAIISLAYLLRGVSGFGSALVAVPLLSLYLPLNIVVPTIALIDYAAGIVHGAGGRHSVSWRDLIALTPTISVGAFTALFLLHNVDTTVLEKLLAAMLLGYAVHLLSSSKHQYSGGYVWALPFGFMGGSVSTLFGTGGPFYVIYLQLRAKCPKAFQATIAVALLIDGTLRLGGYWWTGLLDWTVVAGAILALPIMFIALHMGTHLQRRVDPVSFRRLVALLVAGSALTLLFKA